MDNIEFSQLFLTLNYEAERVKDKLNITVFFNNHGKMIDSAQYNVMPASNMWKTNMPVIATDDMSAKFLLATHTIKKKYFYIWSLDWLMKKARKVEDNLALYCNNKLELLVRDEDMYKLVSSVWKKPTGILDDFNSEQLCEIAAR